MSARADAPSGSGRGPVVAIVGLLAGLAYLPALWTAPGVVAADTKQYLYLDPGRYVSSAASLWDPDQFGGWVTHQTIGYLWPMGPFHWLLHTVGVPVWVAQRLWLGTLLVLAGTGVWWCARLLGLSQPGATAAAVLYQLSPYVLLYAPRTSVILLPWAGLGWLLGLTVLAARRGGWRYPAAAALVVATMAGTNATAAVLVGLAPALWLVWAMWGSREIRVGRGLAAAGRIALLSLATCAAWIVAIVVEARYGADVLAYSETLSAVSSTSLASEVVRGLGYWLFYGGDVTGPWNSASQPYLTAPLLIGLGLFLALVGVAAAVLVRWANRGFVALLLLVGVVVSVGAHPLADPSLYGRLLSGSARSTIVLALRSSTRALPLVVLGLALAVGAGVAALGVRLPATATLAAAAVAVLAALNLPALWNGTYVDGLQRRPSDVPAAWTAAAGALDTLAAGSRVLELPGAEFAAYRWGTTNDAILPGLTSRPTLTRDLLPLGSPGLMDLLLALDDRFQTGTVEGPELAPVARLLAAGGIVVRGDSAFERYRTPRPEPTEALYASEAPGLGAPASFGPAAPNDAAVAGLDEWALGDPGVGAPVAPVQVVPVEDPLPVVRARPAAAPVVVDGDGEGIVAAAAAGLVDGQRTVLQAAAFPDPAALGPLAAQPGAALVVTDSNRERARQWRGSQDTTGFTEDGHDGVLRADDADARLPVFPDAGPGASTRNEQRGGVTVRATAYGEPNAYRPEDRPALAMDGDLSTAWRVGDRGEVLGERLRFGFDAGPRDVEQLTVVQPQDPAANRWITEVTVRTDRGAVTLPLTDASRTPAGQALILPASVAGSTSSVELEVAGTNVGRRSSYFGIGPVGFAEVGLDGLRVDEVVVLPTDLLSAAGPASADHDLAFVLTRLRHDPHDRWRDDEERAMVRELALPTGRPFTVAGTARLSARATDAVLAGLLADPTGDAPAAADTQVSALSRLGGTPAAWGRAAVDGDLATAWTSAFGTAAGASLTVPLDAPATVSGLSLAIVNDGRHSVPTRLSITSEAGEQRLVDVPAPAVVAPSQAAATQTLTFEPLRASTLTISVAEADQRTTLDRRSGEAVILPVAISELRPTGASATVPPLLATFDTGCRSDLVTVDGAPLPVRITGDTADLLARKALPVVGCESAALSLAAGTHQLRTLPGLATGLDLDRLVLSSPGTGAAAATPAAPVVTVDDHGSTSISGTVTPTAAGGPFWLVLGQGLNRGWRASVGGRDLGPPRAIDGGMNGWLVTEPGAGPVAFSMTWTPQRWVDASLVVAALAVLACLVLLARTAARCRPRAAAAPPHRPIPPAAPMAPIRYRIGAIRMPDRNSSGGEGRAGRCRRVARPSPPSWSAC